MKTQETKVTPVTNEISYQDETENKVLKMLEEFRRWKHTGQDEDEFISTQHGIRDYFFKCAKEADIYMFNIMSISTGKSLKLKI